MSDRSKYVEVFQFLDRDKDGILCAEDFVKGLHSLGFVVSEDVVLPKSLDYAAFSAEAEKYHQSQSKPEFRELLRTSFKNLSSGDITKEALRKLVVANGTTHCVSVEDFDNVFSDLDDTAVLSMESFSKVLGMTYAV